MNFITSKKYCQYCKIYISPIITQNNFITSLVHKNGMYIVRYKLLHDEK